MTVSPNPLQRIPPHVVKDQLLPADEVRRLLTFTVENEACFRPASIGATVGPGRVDTAYRTARIMEHAVFKPWRAAMRTAIAPLLPDITRDLGMKPFDLARYELELVRHNDGDFFRRHIDTGKDGGLVGQRVISMVYYFHADPKAFTGGTLRLYSLASNAIFADIEPAHNRLVAFPSWAPHEVMPISCPSGRFVDSRFAINCWARMVVPGQPPA